MAATAHLRPDPLNKWVTSKGIEKPPFGGGSARVFTQSALELERLKRSDLILAGFRRQATIVAITLRVIEAQRPATGALQPAGGNRRGDSVAFHSRWQRTPPMDHHAERNGYTGCQYETNRNSSKANRTNTTLRRDVKAMNSFQFDFHLNQAARTLRRAQSTSRRWHSPQPSRASWAITFALTSPLERQLLATQRSEAVPRPVCNDSRRQNVRDQ